MKTFLMIYTFLLNSGETIVAMDDEYVMLAESLAQCERVVDLQAEKFRQEWKRDKILLFQGVTASCMEVSGENR